MGNQISTLIGLVFCVSCFCVALAGAQEQANPQTLEYLEQGSALYIQGDLKSAIAPYQKALDLEKIKPTLSKTMWRVLVDNLGVSYGVTHDLKKAKAVFEYGLEKDPKYPMFHYNMACTYAEMDDLDKTIVFLKQAFAYKQNMNEGEKMPDPWTDSSFTRFLDNEKFTNTLREIVK